MTVVHALARPYAPGEYEAAHRAERAVPMYEPDPNPAPVRFPFPVPESMHTLGILLEWTQRQTEPWSRRDAHRALRRHLPRSEDVQPYLDRLAAAGVIEPAGQRPTGSQPERTGPKYQLYRTVRQ